MCKDCFDENNGFLIIKKEREKFWKVDQIVSDLLFIIDLDLYMFVDSF